MNPGLEKDRRKYELVAMGVIILVLAASLTYLYESNSSEISSLKQTEEIFCKAAQTEYNPLVEVLTNGTNTLQQQVTSDQALIASLNSSKPSGYASVIATLTQQVSQDQAVLTLLNNLMLATVNPGGPERSGPGSCAGLNG